MFDYGTFDGTEFNGNLFTGDLFNDEPSESLDDMLVDAPMKSQDHGRLSTAIVDSIINNKSPLDLLSDSPYLFEKAPPLLYRNNPEYDSNLFGFDPLGARHLQDTLFAYRFEYDMSGGNHSFDKSSSQEEPNGPVEAPIQEFIYCCKCGELMQKKKNGVYYCKDDKHDQCCDCAYQSIEYPPEDPINVSNHSSAALDLAAARFDRMSLSFPLIEDRFFHNHQTDNAPLFTFSTSLTDLSRSVGSLGLY